jgi:hypothetical protein
MLQYKRALPLVQWKGYQVSVHESEVQIKLVITSFRGLRLLLLAEVLSQYFAVLHYLKMSAFYLIQQAGYHNCNTSNSHFESQPGTGCSDRDFMAFLSS